MKLDQLANQIVANPKNVLVIDTCIGLDIIRSPTRIRPATLNAAIEIDDQIKAGGLPYHLVITSLYTIEAHSHEQDTEDTLRREIRNHIIAARSLALVHVTQGVPGDPPITVDYSIFDYPRHLRRLYDRIIKAAIAIDPDPIFERAAQRRLISGRAPAKQGSAKHLQDCQVFEETLALGNNLATKGYTGRVIFASSNTNEYRSGVSTKPDIVADLDAIRGKYVTSLEDGHAQAS